MSLQEAVAVRNVSRLHNMGTTVVHAVDGVSLSVARGEFVALLGSSGSGKSSLLNLIAGLDHATGGEIVVNGRDLARLSREELAKYRRNDVGVIFQAFHLVPTMTVAQNVELPLRFAEVERGERDARVREALTRVGLAHRMGHTPSEISGGEQQRTAIARALVNRPRLLLADEPTGNLDSKTGAEIMLLLAQLNQEGMTIIMVTHERALAERYTQRMVFMSDGKLVGEEVLAAEG
jgi:putative ABC transport system ATP-binding protein